MMILFLDFDGVLHPNGRGDIKLFCCVALLWKILRTCPDVKVVFSTSWREIYNLEEMAGFVTSGGGEDLVPRFIGRIPSFADVGYYPRRDIEIQSWLDTNCDSCQWLAIDDMPELFNSAHPNLYIVNGDCGLTEVDVLAIIRKIK